MTNVTICDKCDHWDEEVYITEFDITVSDATFFQEIDITEFDITVSDVTFFQEIGIRESDAAKKGKLI